VCDLNVRLNVMDFETVCLTLLFIFQGCVGRLMATQATTLLVEGCQLIGSKHGGRWIYADVRHYNADQI